MTPEEKYHSDKWFVLQKIRERELYTPNKNKIQYYLEITPYSQFEKHPPSAQISILKQLTDEKVVEILHEENESGYGAYYLFVLQIKRPKFDEIYHLYESDYKGEADKKSGVNANQPPVIKPKTLELIAREIGNLDAGNNLFNFLIDCGVKKEIIEYPQTKWRMVYSVLLTLAASSNYKDREILFKIIEEASHPLMHNGDEELAKKYENKFDRLLKYDGFALRNYKIKKISEEAKEDRDLTLYLKKKILVENWRDDVPHQITELSFNNNTIEQICYSLWDLFIPDIISFGVNTSPEDILIEADPRFHKEIAFNWNLIHDLDNNPHKVENDYGFDIEVLDEKRLKKDVDEEIDEFVSNNVNKEKIEGARNFYTDTKYFEIPSHLRGIAHNYYTYKKQKEALLNFMAVLYEKFENEILVVKFDDITDRNVNALRTLLALEKEGVFIITELRNDKKEWTDKDNIYAKVKLVKSKIPIIKKFLPVTKEQKPETEEVMQKSLTTKIEVVKMPPLEFKTTIEKQSLSKNLLKSVQITYNDEKAILKIGKQECQLPPFKNEHFFCRAMFQFPIKEFVDWSLIYEKFEGVKSKDKVKDKRTVQDAMYAVNRRVKEVINTNDDLFTWKEKSIRRNY